MKSFIALLLAAAATMAMAAPTGVARLAPDGLSVEFVFSNPGTQAYRCAMAEASVRLTGASGLRPAQVFNIVLPAGAKDLVVAQPHGQVDTWRAMWGSDVRATLPDARVAFPAAGCDLDQQKNVFLLALDDRTSCSDARRIARVYAVDLKLRTITAASSPLAIDNGFKRIISPPAGRPVAYGLHDAAPRRLAAWDIDNSLTAMPELPLPTAPRGITRAGGPELLLPVIAMNSLDPSTLVIAFQPALLLQSNPLKSRVVLDVVELSAGAPVKVTRHEIDVPFSEGTELLIARSQHQKDAATLFLTGPGLFRTTFSPQAFIGPRIDAFEPPRRTMTLPAVVRIDAARKASGWGFAAPPTSIGMGLGDRVAFLSSGARAEAAPAQEIRIDDVLIRLTGASKAQGLQAWSLAAGTAPVLSQATTPDLCDVQLVSMDARSYSDGTVALNTADAAGKTKLHHLVEEGDLADVSSWLSRRPLVNVRDNGKYTPLMLAMKGNRGDLVGPLLAAGADFRLATPDTQGTLRDPVAMLFEYGCDTCITPLRAASFPLDKLSLTDGKLDDSKRMLCSMRGQDNAILGRLPQPVPDEMKKMVAVLLQRKNIEAALKLDCSKP